MRRLLHNEDVVEDFFSYLENYMGKKIYAKRETEENISLSANATAVLARYLSKRTRSDNPEVFRRLRLQLTKFDSTFGSGKSLRLPSDWTATVNSRNRQDWSEVLDLIGINASNRIELQRAMEGEALLISRTEFMSHVCSQAEHQYVLEFANFLANGNFPGLAKWADAQANSMN